MNAAGNIPKASFNVFALLHKLGSVRLPVDSTNAIVTRQADGSAVIAVWNYFEPQDVGSPKQVTLQFSDLPGKWKRARVSVVDNDHGSPQAAWQKMGSPQWPSREQQRQLREAGALPQPRLHAIQGKALTLELQPHALALIELIP